jgi:hypothetical protein
MEKPKVGERFTAYFKGQLLTSTIVEWVENRCYFENGYYLVWGGEDIGFLF